MEAEVGEKKIGRCYAASLGDGGRGHDSRDAGSL